METPTKYETDDAAMEIRALVDLVEANVAPNTETAAWETEIAALQSEAAEAPAPNAAIAEAIELSTALA